MGDIDMEALVARARIKAMVTAVAGATRGTSTSDGAQCPQVYASVHGQVGIHSIKSSTLQMSIMLRPLFQCLLCWLGNGAPFHLVVHVCVPYQYGQYGRTVFWTILKVLSSSRKCTLKLKGPHGMCRADMHTREKA